MVDDGATAGALAGALPGALPETVVPAEVEVVPELDEVVVVNGVDALAVVVAVDIAVRPGMSNCGSSKM